MLFTPGWKIGLSEGIEIVFRWKILSIVFSIRKDIYSFLRNLRLNCFCRRRLLYSHHEHDPFNKLQPKISTWTPRTRQSKVLDTFIHSTKLEFEQYVSPKPSSLENLWIGERNALRSLKNFLTLSLRRRTKRVPQWSEDATFTFRNLKCNNQTLPPIRNLTKKTPQL